MRGVLDIDDQQTTPVQPLRQPRRGDRGHRGGVLNHEPDPGRRQHRVDRHIRRPGLEHRQHRHDRLSASGQTTTPPTAPGPHPCPTSRCANRFDASSSSRYVIEQPSKVTATASGARATCAANTTGIDTAGIRLGQHRPITRPIQPGMLTLIEHIHRRQPPAPDQPPCATNTRSNRPAKSDDSRFENGCPAPVVLKSCSSPLQGRTAQSVLPGQKWYRSLSPEHQRDPG